MRLRLLLPRGGGRAELRRLGLTPERDLDWDGCVNARDLGGLPTVDGQMTRPGALIRSEAVDRLSPEGWRSLREYGVRTIIDLRNDDERGEPADGVETIHIPLDRLEEDPEFWVDWMHGLSSGRRCTTARSSSASRSASTRCSTRSSRRSPAECSFTASEGVTGRG